MTVQGHTQVLKTPHAITEFEWSVTQSSLQPKSSALRFPRVLSPEGCDVWHKVWDLIMVWFTQWELNYMRRTHYGNDKTYTHTYFLLMLGHRSWRRLCGNMGYGVKPFIMCNFHYSDIYWDTNKGLYFQGIPCKILFASSKTPCLVLEVYSLSSFILMFLYWIKSEVPVKIRTKETLILLLLILWQRAFGEEVVLIQQLRNGVFL